MKLHRQYATGNFAQHTLDFKIEISSKEDLDKICWVCDDKFIKVLFDRITYSGTSAIDVRPIVKLINSPTLKSLMNGYWLTIYHPSGKMWCCLIQYQGPYGFNTNQANNI